MNGPGRLNAATLFALTAAASMPDVHISPGPYSMPRGQSCKNRKARPDKKAKRKQRAKSRKRNRR